MQPWLIALIVILIVLFVVLPSVIFSYAGFTTLKTLKKSDAPLSMNKNFDVSFYQNGPMPSLVQEGMTYLETLFCEDVYIKSYDGTRLHAYIYKNPKMKSNRYFLGMHGFKSSPKDDYGFHVKYYFDLGFNVIIPDERAHGKSDGKFICMGLKEKYDIKAWCKYIVTTFGEEAEILIQGTSMGGASVCLASGLDLPKQVIGIISDCAYASVKEELNFTLDKVAKGMPKGMLLLVINLFIQARLHVSLNDEQPIDAVKKAKVPILFFHGENDQMVPTYFAHDLYNACRGKKKLIIVKDANHAESIAYKRDQYFQDIKDFFNL